MRAQISTLWTLAVQDELDAPFLRMVYSHSEQHLARRSFTDVHVLLMVDLYYRTHSPWDSSPPEMPQGVASAAQVLMRRVRSPCG